MSPGSRVPLRIAGAALVLLALGQTARTKKAFPLMPYTMYGRAATGNVTYYEYQAHYRSGARERFRPSIVISTLGRARIVKGLALRLDAVARTDASGRPDDRQLPLVRDTIAALAAEYNRERRNDPVTRIDVLRADLAPPYAPSTLQRRLVMSIDPEVRP